MSNLTFADILPTYFGISVEDLQSKELHEELELTIYVEMKDIKDLEKAVSKEIHEQYNVPLNTETNIRQRIRGVNGKRWFLTLKRPHESKPGNWESEDDISECTFKLFREATPEDGHVKERYFFPVIGTDLVYEVDVFRGNGGVQHNWVKIDLEFKDTTTEIPPLPFATNARIFADSPDCTDAERKWIDQLWDVEWQKNKLTA